MSRLDDPEYARFAWGRFRRLLGWSGVVGLVASVLAIWLVGRAYGALGWVATLAMIGGVTGSVLMAGALMGLTFLSSGTGHDEAVDTRDFDDDDR
ncbi:hypothetical protein [Sphingomonas dokdonensis]|uniref:hypothetical protein n=1 Tax=Sphingomonas dokdonensis TaxID=344880 RepID=UPI001FE5F7A8|nr:hypothetical protein [Sphingomonas dokdonensis]